LRGDELALEVLRDTGRFLGIGIANIINTLNPAKATTILTTKLGDHATAIGAATMVLKRLFLPDMRNF
jgi:predicted NBD/HSP70 family sugar kinase